MEISQILLIALNGVLAIVIFEKTISRFSGHLATQFSFISLVLFWANFFGFLLLFFTQKFTPLDIFEFDEDIGMVHFIRLASIGIGLVVFYRILFYFNYERLRTRRGR